MPEVLVATPLNSSAVTRSYSFGNGISIRELSPIRWDVAIIKSDVSEREREELAKTKYWLCAAKEYEHAYDSDDNELVSMAYAAAMALQILCPIGAKHQFLEFEPTPSGWDNVSSSPPNKPLCKTLLGKITHLEDQGFPDHFAAVYEGIRRANTEKLLRLQNPVLLLEHGMQTGHPYLGTLMFVMGLDVLFMAGESAGFMHASADSSA
jgi:hypothetical protein